MKYRHKEKPTSKNLDSDDIRLLMQDVIDNLIKKNVLRLNDFKDKSQKIIKRMDKEQDKRGKHGTI